MHSEPLTMVFLWDVELFAYLRLCILWHFCKEQEHARTNIKYQYLYLEGKKRWEQRREEGGKETRKHRREGGRTWRVRVSQMPLSLSLPFILLSTRIFCLLLCGASPPLLLIILHTQFMRKSLFDSWKNPGTKDKNQPRATKLVLRLGTIHQLGNSPSNPKFSGTLFCSLCG